MASMLSLPVEPPCGVSRPTRTTLVRSAVALVEDLQSPGVATTRPPEDFSPDFQVCLPYRGLFVWHVGGDDVVGDATQVLFVTGGEAFRLSQPRAGAYAEVIVTPGLEVLDEVAGGGRRRWSGHPLFRRRSRLADPTLQHRVAHLLHAGRRRAADTLADDEAVVDLLRAALHAEPRRSVPTSRAQRLTRLAKEYLHAHLAAPVRLSDVAAAVGASPAYLTDLFRRVEGVPLHRYLTRLRLARALAELPGADDLTGLALDLGFCSHSHFTATFRRAFGASPSAVRASLRRCA